MGEVMHTALRWLGRWLALLLLCGLSLQIVFLLSIFSLRLWQPPSTSFQRSAVWEKLRQAASATAADAASMPVWWHQPVASAQIADHARKAVIASEDNHFFTHSGVDWPAVQRAWREGEAGGRVRGGSTITQQLAKNLYLSRERNLLRKGQELALTWMLEAALDKPRILDLYLNHVEWGDALYGIEAAAQHYFAIPAQRLSARQAAQLAVLLPQPRALGRQLSGQLRGQPSAQPSGRGGGRYVQQRARVIEQRMAAMR